jgi:signal transduction histidine kinase
VQQPTTLRDRLGGRWAISLRGTLIVDAFLLVATLVERGAGLLPMSLLAIVVNGAVLLLGNRTIFRNRAVTPVPAWWTIALVMIATAAGWTTMVLGSSVLGPATTGPPVGQGILLVPVLLVGMTLLLDEVERVQKAAAGTAQQLVDLRLSQGVRDELLEAIIVEVQAEIDAATAGLRTDLERSQGDDDRRDGLAIAHALEAAVESGLRPLSQRLYAAHGSVPPALPTTRSFAEPLAVATLYPFATGVFFLGFSLLLMTAAHGAGFAVVHSPLYAASAGLGVLIAEVAARHQRRLERLRIPLAMACVMLTTSTANWAITAVAHLPYENWPLASNLVWAPMLVLVFNVAAFTVIGQRREISRRQSVIADRTLEALVASRELVFVSRELAQYLHGTLQADLLAAAFAIQTATRSSDADAVTAAMGKALVALRTRPTVAPACHDLREEVDHRLALWRGFGTVSAEISVTSELPPFVVQAVGRIVGEGITNAAKHGNAEAIAITISPLGDRALHIVIADDGLGLAARTPGLGSAYFDTAAPDAWSLAANPVGRGAVLTVDLALPIPA